MQGMSSVLLTFMKFVILTLVYHTHFTIVPIQGLSISTGSNLATYITLATKGLGRSCGRKRVMANPTRSFTSSLSYSTPSSPSFFRSGPAVTRQLNVASSDPSDKVLDFPGGYDPDPDPEIESQIEAETSNVPNKKLHSMTVCMVPEAKYDHVWEALTKARTELRDPGLFRWPPHANMLYPFLDIQSRENDDSSVMDEDVLTLLQDATRQCEPFRVSLKQFGTFGGKARGVLYIYPYSFRPIGDTNSHGVDDSDEYEEPLVQLQSYLQTNIPECHEQKKNGQYTPHITLSHFKTLDDALEGQRQIEQWWEALEFDVSEIYCLKREGDNGQFKILAAFPLGANTSGPIVYPEPIPFPGMPLVEEDWVREERMALKARRNGNGRRGNRKKTRSKGRNMDRGPSKSRDTPEEIAKKRAERALKRERLAREAAEIEEAIRCNGIDFYMNK